MNTAEINRAARFVSQNPIARAALAAAMDFPLHDEFEEVLNAAAEMDDYVTEWRTLYYNKDCAAWFVRFPVLVDEALEEYDCKSVCQAVNLARDKYLSELLLHMVEALEEVEVPNDFE